MNLLTTYRLILFLFTLYEIQLFVKKVLQYKKYYNKLPGKIRKYFNTRSLNFMMSRLKAHQGDILLNGILLVILLILNFFVYFY